MADKRTHDFAAALHALRPKTMKTLPAARAKMPFGRAGLKTKKKKGLAPRM